jgi:prephenate dehydratase
VVPRKARFCCTGSYHRIAKLSGTGLTEKLVFELNSTGLMQTVSADMLATQNTRKEQRQTESGTKNKTRFLLLNKNEEQKENLSPEKEKTDSGTWDTYAHARILYYMKFPDNAPGN